jgi:HlyD family secretion protein
MKIELKKEKPWFLIISGCIFLILVGLAIYVISEKNSREILIDDVEYSKVKRGDVLLTIDAYGEFVPAVEQILTAPDQGKVIKILARAGASVEPDSVVLILENLALEQEYEKAKVEFRKENAGLQSYEFEQEKQRIDFLAGISAIEANLEKLQLDYTILEELSGRGVVSKIEFKKSELSLKQEIVKLDFEKQKHKQFVEMQRFQKEQRVIELAQRKSTVVSLSVKLGGMEIEAGISGAVQEFNVEIGQTVRAGESLAKIGSDDDLIAQLKVAAYEANKLVLGNRVLVRVNERVVEAVIARIESKVVDGSILVEAYLSDQGSNEFRPSQTIVAEIVYGKMEGQLYIEHIPGVQPNTTAFVYVSEGENTLRRIEVVFGGRSSGNIIVREGLESNMAVAVIDLSKYEDFETLKITK